MVKLVKFSPDDNYFQLYNNNIIIVLSLLPFAIHCSCLYVASVTDSLFSLPTGGPGPWRELSHDTAYSGYCVLAVCESHPHLLSIGNLKGSIKLLNISDAGEGLCSVQ